MIYSYLIKNGKVVYPEKTVTAHIAIENGKIKTVTKEKNITAKNVIDASGFYVLPGLIDPHIHPVYLDDLSRISVSAAFGGCTTMIHYVPAQPGQSLMHVLKDFISRAKVDSALDFALHGALFDTRNQAAEIPEAINLGVSSFKMFTAYQKLGWMTDDYALALAMDTIAKHGGIASVHAENGLVIDYLEDRLRALKKDMGSFFLDTSPSILDREAILRTLSIGKITACPVYLPHISSQMGLMALKIAKNEGICFYSETCPHYLTFCWDELKNKGPLGKLRPPIKTAKDREELWKAVAKGVIDTIGSDHAPKNKQQGADFFEAPYGAPGVETILPVMWELGVNKNRITVNQLVALISENTAKIFGLFPQKGRLEPGADADIVIFDPLQKWKISHNNQHSNAPYTLYEGQECQGKVIKVFAKGRIIVDCEDYYGSPGQGRFLKTKITL